MLNLMTVDPPPPSAIADPPDPSNALGAAAETPRRRLGVFRSARDRYVAGVAGGVAERLNVDPLFIRLGLVAATLFLNRDASGAGAIPLLAYFVAWLILPSRSDQSLLRRIGQRSAQQEIVGAGAVLALTLLLLSRPTLIWAGVLFAIAVAMLTDRGVAAEQNETEPNGTTSIHDPHAPQPLSESDRARTWGRSLRGAPLFQREPRVRAPRRPARTPKLWPLTLSLIFAYGFACVLLDNLLAGGVDPGVAVNGALLIIGAVMMLSGWRGRAWLTMLLVLPLIPLWYAFSVAGADRVPDLSFAVAPNGYESGDVIRASRGYGGLLVDLSRAELPPSGEITAHVGITAGQVDVWVPREAELRIIGEVGLGNIEVFQEFEWYATSIELLADWGLNRSYAALGRECVEIVSDDSDLRFTAEISNVAISSSATGIEVADAVEAAGYPRPRVETIEQVTQAFEEETDNYLIDPSTGEPMLEIVDQWTFQVNTNGGLCVPEPAPESPLVITIDATIGLGNLKVHRV